MSTLRTLVVGIGSPHGDDRVGWLAIQHLSRRVGNGNGLDLRIATSPTQLLDWLDGVERLIVCDACRGLGAVGSVKRWQWPSASLEEPAWSGTHDLSLAAALHLAAQLGGLPETVLIWSVEAGNNTALDGLSPVVSAALPKLVAALFDELERSAA